MLSVQCNCVCTGTRSHSLSCRRPGPGHAHEIERAKKPTTLATTHMHYAPCYSCRYTYSIYIHTERQRKKIVHSIEEVSGSNCVDFSDSAYTHCGHALLCAVRCLTRDARCEAVMQSKSPKSCSTVLYANFYFRITARRRPGRHTISLASNATQSALTGAEEHSSSQLKPQPSVLLRGAPASADSLSTRPSSPKWAVLRPPSPQLQ